jgi:hypothetical protein
MILIHESDGELKFPLIQRPDYEGVHSGQIALPGGRYETIDQTLTNTALRETKEEIGVDSIEVIGSLSQFYVAASNYDILPVVGFTKRKPVFIPDPTEVKEVITPTISQLLSRNNVKEKELVVRGGVKLWSPYFELEQRVVWGATAMMLSEFVDIIQDGPWN